MRLSFALPISLIFFSTIVIYFQSLGYYFFQDDWFILNRINNQHLISFFKPQTDIIYYRPLGMQTFFYLSHKLFGLNPFGYHVIAFSTHLLNATLLFAFLYKVFKKRLPAMLGAFIWATAPFHFMTLSWLALSWNVFGTFFTLCVFHCYLKILYDSKLVYQFIIYAFFLLALASSEFALITPFFLVVFAFFFLDKTIPEILKKSKGLIFAMLATALVYLVMRFIFFPIPAIGSYRLELNFVSVKTLFWYFLWIFNIPEELKYQIVLSKMQLTPSILADGTAFLLPTLVASLLTIVSFLAVIYRSRVKVKVILGALLIFMFYISPVIFLPSHTYTYYLTLSSLGFVLLISKAVLLLQKRPAGAILATIYACIWFFSAFLSVSLSRQTHWVTMEQSISRSAVEVIRESIPPTVAPGSEVTIQTGVTMLKAALLDQEALQVIFEDRTIKTLYHQNPYTFPKQTDYMLQL